MSNNNQVKASSKQMKCIFSVHVRKKHIATNQKRRHSWYDARHYESHNHIQQNKCVRRSVMCRPTYTLKIIYHRVFRHILCVITLLLILSTVCITHVEKLWFHCNTTFVLIVDCKELNLTVSRNKRNDISFIGKNSSAINLNNA